MMDWNDYYYVYMHNNVDFFFEGFCIFMSHNASKLATINVLIQTVKELHQHRTGENAPSCPTLD